MKLISSCISALAAFARSPGSHQLERAIMILARAKEAQHEDAIGVETIEDTVVPIGTAPDAVALVARHQRVAPRNIGDPASGLTQFVDEADRAFRIVRFDMLRDVIEICQCTRRQSDFHRV